MKTSLTYLLLALCIVGTIQQICDNGSPTGTECSACTDDVCDTCTSPIQKPNAAGDECILCPGANCDSCE